MLVPSGLNEPKNADPQLMYSKWLMLFGDMRFFEISQVKPGKIFNIIRLLLASRVLSEVGSHRLFG